ncbi:MAG: C2 domain-containing protein [Euryarchaeota archaeon]|nr:C2 domain-containing protein [Euryarchaeota archaeon]
MKKHIVSFIATLLVISLCTTTMLVMHAKATTNTAGTLNDTDIDPLVDVSVTVTIKEIRSLEAKQDIQKLPISKIDRFSDPDFYVKVIINENESTSPIWYNTKYVYNPNWSTTFNVPDEIEFVNVTIQLWDHNPLGFDRLCDISGNSEERPKSSDIQLQYSIRTGHWTGDDYVGGSFFGGPDPSGYGRANGCDDNSYYQNDRDCELWFDINQTDPDGDGIPYWTEVNIFHTDPTINNATDDPNNDGIPLWWDFKWGFTQSFHHGPGGYFFGYNWTYNPFLYTNYSNLDPDNDGLSNLEEYLTSQWGSDPFCKDLFIEMDQMMAGPNGEPASIFPNGAKELLRTAYDKHNIVYHLDDGTWADTGSEMIPFDDLTEMSWGGSNTTNELQQIYNDYFLHGNTSNWRRGVFHYGPVIYQCSVANGNAFGGGAFQISYYGLNNKTKSYQTNKKDIVFASAYMHETGHAIAIENPAVDNSNNKFIYQLGWWQWRHYKSVMNYGYMFTMVDYSDGSHGKNDFNDWITMDLTAFQQGFF